MATSDIIKSFGKRKVLLVGDTILDVYSQGREVCKSSDSQAVEVEEGKISVSFGGASLVASNMLELGAKVIFFSVVGCDEAAKHYDDFKNPNLQKHFFVDKERPTTVKKRFWVSGQKLFQVNQVNNDYISTGLEKKIIREMTPLMKNIDVMVVLDAQHGLLSKELIADLLKLSKKYQKPMYVDSQISHRPSNHYLYREADCLFLNQKEARAVNTDSLKNNYIIKLGEEGSRARFNGKRFEAAPYKVKAVDPCGAGDAFLAAFSLGERNAVTESLTVANTWAALSTKILGTIPPKKQDLINILKHG